MGWGQAGWDTLWLLNPYTGSLHASLRLVKPRAGQYNLAARALGWGWGVRFEVGRGAAAWPGWRQGFLRPLWVQLSATLPLFPLPCGQTADRTMSVSDSAHRSSDPLPAQKDGLGLPLPDRRTPSWPPSPDGDPGLPPFPLEEAVPRPVAPGNLPSPALSLEEDEGEENEDEEDAAELEGLRSEEHPSQFFNEARRLREQRLLLDEEVSVAGRVYRVHRVILAAVSSLFRDRMLGGTGPRPPLSLDVAAGAWEAALTFAYEGFLGPAPWGDVLVVAEALGAPRVKAAAQRRGKGAGSPGEDEKQPSRAEELRENLRNIELLYKDGVGCDLELEAGGCRLRGEDQCGMTLLQVQMHVWFDPYYSGFDPCCRQNFLGGGLWCLS